MKKEKRVLNRWFVVALASFMLVIISLFKIPRFRKEQALYALGYTEEEASIIFHKNIDSIIIDNNYYSSYLASEIKKDDFDSKHVGLYAVNDHTDAKYIALYDRLKQLREYSDAELLELFGEISYDGLTALLVFDKVNVDEFIDDWKNNENSESTAIKLSNNYIILNEENISLIADPSDVETYLSKRCTIDKYEPEKLVAIPERYGVANQYLTSIALQKFEEMCDDLAANVEGEGIYAVGSYTSYEQQEVIYARYGLEADQYTDKPGSGDAQLGLSIEVVSSKTASIRNFNTTASYTYLKQHAHEFGFIERYPSGKSAITLHDDNPSYWRYVGEDLAAKIFESGLTFDEYYYFYIYEQ